MFQGDVDENGHRAASRAGAVVVTGRPGRNDETRPLVDARAYPVPPATAATGPEPAPRKRASP
jgi:hypothetical protein